MITPCVIASRTALNGIFEKLESLAEDFKVLEAKDYISGPKGHL